MGFKKTRYIGNHMLESECIKCGEVMIWGPGDDLFIRVDEEGEKAVLCSKCYDGPRATHLRDRLISPER